MPTGTIGMKMSKSLWTEIGNNKMTDALKAAVREAWKDHVGFYVKDAFVDDITSALALRGVVVVPRMRPEPKPARKVVQITCSDDDGLWALDEDGSIWALDMRKDMPWLKLPPLPQPGDER